MQSFLHKKEFKNYFKFAVKNLQAHEILFALAKFSCVRLMNRRVPKEYKSLKSIPLSSYKLDSTHIHTILPLEPFLEKNSESGGVIHLAGQTLSFEKRNLWQTDFKDIEDQFSLHRFGWLIYSLSESSAVAQLQKIETILLDWIKSNPENIDEKGWDSYSISERMVNWIYFLIIAKHNRPCDKKSYHRIIASLLSQMTLLINHLEFRFSGTNNHLLNNGRALYITGSYLNHDAARSIGHEIILACSKNMFSASGFLNEGSSHYQILMARTFFEVYWCAYNTKDIQFLGSIATHVKKVIRSALYFIDASSFPFFGDVSPDFFPEFHVQGLKNLKFKTDTSMSYSLTGKKSWDKLFTHDTLTQTKKIIQLSSESEKDIVVYPDAGHFRFSNGDYTLVLYVNPMGYVPEWSHGHSDIGSFVLYWKKIPVFIDVGRYSFQKTLLGLYGRSVRSHNSISIEGHEPCVTHGLNGYAQLISSNYIGLKPEVFWEHKGDSIIIKVTFHGFRRIWPETQVCRIFNCCKDKIEIEDRITGKNVKRIETFFHLHPEVNIAETSMENIVFSLPGKIKLSLSSERLRSADVKVFRGCESPHPAGWYFPRYGEKVKTNTLIFTDKASLPFKTKYTLKAI